MAVEIGIGVSEASNNQLLLCQQLVAEIPETVIHADHADGSVHPQFIRDAFDTFSRIGDNCPGPRDMHIHIQDKSEIFECINRFSSSVHNARNIHFALDANEDIALLEEILSHSKKVNIGFVPAIQTDPLRERSVKALIELLPLLGNGVSVLTASRSRSDAEAAVLVSDLHRRLSESEYHLSFSLDRNCTPSRVNEICRCVTVSSIVCGSFLWTSNSIPSAIMAIRNAAKRTDS